MSTSAFPVTIEERKRGKVAFITLNGLPPNNTLTRAMLLEFIETMNDAGSKADGIIVTSGHEKFFSNGLDGKTLLEADQKERVEIVKAMTRFFGKLVAFEKPWIAELTGYTMAGGAVLALAADYRYMLAGGGRIGFSELAVGLPLPLVYTHGMHRVVQAAAVRSLVEGNAFKPDEALAIGLIDGVEESREALRSACLKRMDGILRLDQEAFLPTRKLYRSALLREIERDEPIDIQNADWIVKQPAFERAINNIAGKNR